jgi:hypothetical protein
MASARAAQILAYSQAPEIPLSPPEIVRQLKIGVGIPQAHTQDLEEKAVLDPASEVNVVDYAQRYAWDFPAFRR